MKRILAAALLLLALSVQSHAEPSGRQEPKGSDAESTAAGDTSGKPATTPEELKAEYDQQLAEIARRREESRKQFDAILAGYKAGRRPVAEVIEAYEAWIRLEGAYHSWIATWVLYSQVKLQDLKEYAESRTFTEVAPGQSVPVTEVHQYAQNHSISPEEASQKMGQEIEERSIKEHAEKYGISIEEAKRQIEYYNAHYRQ